MAKLDRLKAQARQHEANGEYGQALYLYERALRQLESADDELPDPMLYVRVADLTFRRGQVDRAREFYGEAAGHFEDQGLLNNAIAVWKRIVLAYPDETSPRWRLVELHLDLNLVAEARAHLREMLAELREDGRLGEATEAAETFLARSYDEEVESWLRELQESLPAGEGTPGEGGPVTEGGSGETAGETADESAEAGA